METASYRKKATKIESQLLGKLAMFGQGKFASFLGMNEAQVSRMKVAHGNQKYSFFGLMGMALAMLEVEAPESDIAKTLLRIEQMLTKKKSPALTEDSKQITIEF
ncbi:CII family transcriptional regulator [Rouxiella sp. Mn2063]|uniref:CII family transcriptional regulator n=1 Tax=Rouxiella sp. Mn2063 TaxID=3395262 RepID=UPI003BD1B461